MASDHFFKMVPFPSLKSIVIFKMELITTQRSGFECHVVSDSEEQQEGEEIKRWPIKKTQTQLPKLQSIL